MKRFTWSWILVVAACGGGSGDGGTGGPLGTGQSTSMTVGAAGGTITFESVTLDIPPGALTEDVEIRITSTKEKPPLSAWYSPVYKFEPAGLQFAADVSLTMAFTGTPASGATIWWSKPGVTIIGPNSLAIIGPNVSIIGPNMIAAQVRRFSFGVVGACDLAAEIAGCVDPSGDPPMIGTWTLMNSGTQEALFSVWGTGPSNVFAVGSGGTILHYDGSSWTPMSSGTTRLLHGVWGSGPSDVFAVGDFGTILRFDGSAWSTPMPSGTSLNLRRVWGTGPDNVYAVGIGGIILHYDGTQWWVMSSGTTNSLYGLWGSGPGDILASGDGGTLLRFDGASWSTWGGTFSGQSLYNIWGSGSDIFMVAGDGTIHRSSDGGVAWFGTVSGVSELYGVWGSSATSVFAVGSTETILRYTGMGTDWRYERMNSPKTLYGIWGTGPDDVFAVGDMGLILHRTTTPTGGP